jgi:hypothetical protein
MRLLRLWSRAINDKPAAKTTASAVWGDCTRISQREPT